MSTAASTPTAQTGTHRNPDVAATARPGPGLWTRSLALSRWILREHALVRLLCLGGGTAFVSLCLLLERTGLFSSFLTWAGVAEADQDGISAFRYTSTALVMTLFQNIILGALTATQTTHLLVSGTTRATLGAAHLQVAVLLGCELTGLMVPLTLADLAAGQAPGALMSPGAVLAAFPWAFLLYLAGAWGALTCLRHHVILAVAELLVAVNIVAALLLGAATRWGTAWAGALLCLAAALLVLCGPVGTVVLLRGYQPR